ncbi:hypothetical protein SAMN05661080_04798 [Modestobacter sp. DSM 44400]|uniref:hypothetical protein n=1 Tax=Modestobacter sp. DSM 44400 TaxID=1550230 RepID=UPI00089C8058|nr:hypothetical protein [Modestobacter sp. DSM 44400]SDY84831.1 hypothetical protein SAMN05661080_04798 [Modestobacter sp. DSM 44400]
MIDLDPELAFVGAILHLPAATAAEALSLIGEDDLADPHMQVILRAAGLLVGEEVDPDLYAVMTIIRAAGMASTAHGISLLAEVVIEAAESCPVPASWKFYAAGVLDQAVRRRAIEMADRITQASGGPLDTLLDLVQGEATAVTELGRRRAGIGSAASRLRVVSA